MFREIRKRAKKIGQSPGTPFYTGNKKDVEPRVRVITYTESFFHEAIGKNLDECLAALEQPKPGITWITVEGLSNLPFIEQIAKRYQLHPLTVEDILHVEQRSKLEEFDGYFFTTLKLLSPLTGNRMFSIGEISIVFGKNFVISFLEHESKIFNSIEEKLRNSPTQRLRQHGSDYLVYRLIDTIVDQYFVVLEAIGERIGKIEDRIISSATPRVSRTLYRLRRQMLLLRKMIWPMREVISHLMQAEEKIITPFTRVYLRDVYDHTVQAIDTIETFRDMLSSMLDMYLSSLTNRMNEVMKTLTIIATIFIPITFVASFYGMNFQYMPELHWHAGYPLVISIMVAVVVAMLFYFRKKKWL
ncbi:MAG: magnesium Mg(2+)/cobalt Co(2+) transport protein [uncultured bacterium]|nr:MAG: magnesium Mg(2+)/cobalt Co(2+) transport protein [uncultured bacterium]